MYREGASNREGARVGIVQESSSGVIIEEAFWLEGQMTNNEAECEALLYGLELALRLGVQNLKVFVDSKLITEHVNGIFEAKDRRIKAYCDRVTKLAKHF